MNISEFKGELRNVRRSGNGYMASCPAHNDKNPSLSVKESGGSILLHCFADCETESVVSVLGLEMSDLFTDSNGRQSNNNDHQAPMPSETPNNGSQSVKTSGIAEVYSYTDETGEVLYENIRYEPKDFRQRKPDGKGDYIYNLGDVRRVPYRLPELIKAASNEDDPFPMHGADIFLCEGEKDADNLLALGLTATNSKNWKAEFNKYLKDSHVVIIKDHDQAGITLAEKTCAILPPDVASLKAINLFDGEGLDGQDVSDWIENKRKDGLGNDEIAEKLCVLADNANDWKPNETECGSEESDEKEIKIKLFPTPNEKCFYGLAGDFVRLVEPHTESSKMALLSQFLVYFGNAVGRAAYYQVEGDRHYTNLFCVLVGNTAQGRKGTSLGRVKQVFKGIDENHEKECLTSGLASGEGLLYHVRDAVWIEKIDKKTNQIEPICTDNGVPDKRMLVVESEFSQVLRVQGREGNTLSSFIRNLWDTGTARSLTKNSPLKATDAHVSIIGHITKDELLKTLLDVDSTNGYANRFMFCSVERARFLPFGGDVPITELTSLQDRISDAIEFARQKERMEFSSEASKLWASSYPRLESSHFGYLAKVTQRASPYVLRLSLIFALLDKSHLIEKSHLESALSVWQYAEDSARYIFGNRLGDQKAERILTALKEDRETGLTRTQIRDVFDRHIKTAALDAALLVLLENGLARFEKQETKGRTKEIWFPCVISAKSVLSSENLIDEQPFGA